MLVFEWCVDVSRIDLSLMEMLMRTWIFFHLGEGVITNLFVNEISDFGGRKSS